MSSLPWTKLQDFCLRLGLLKTLVAVMPRERRSVLRDEILAKLDKALFGRLSTCPALEAAARVAIGSDVIEIVPESKRTKVLPSIADGLLLTSGLSSWGQPIDSGTRTKIMEWGQTAHLLGQGNQITERALLLRHLMDEAAITAFLGGDKLAWNPFRITPEEKVFFLYHLGEHDHVLWDLAFAVGQLRRGHCIEAEEARQLTAAAMRRVVTAAERSRGFTQLLELRTLRELTKVIEGEMGIATPVTRARGLPPGPGKPRGPARASKSNADHQTIPRFEMLVDLGFLEKRVDDGLTGRALDRARSGWTYYVTDAAERFSQALAAIGRTPSPPWHWEVFAQTVGASGLVGTEPPRRATPLEAVEAFLRSYGHVERRAGHSPFQSVALFAIATALPKGLIVEMRDLHRIFLNIKTSGALRDLIGFAAGNEIDGMFLLIRPNGHDALRAHVSGQP